MVDSNLTVFSKIEAQTFAFTSDRFLDKSDMIGKSLQVVSGEIANEFFRMMAQRGTYIDVENESYPDISESFWDQKAKRGLVQGSPGGQNRFYFFRGTLEKDLLGVRAGETQRILGRSTFKGLGSDKFSQRQTVFRYGKGSMVNGRSVGGQFGRISDISTTVEIDLFSKLNDASGLNPALYAYKARWTKVLATLDGGRRGKRPIPARPMLARYFNWFMEVEVPKQFLRKIKNQKWKTFDE
jgi:hypothetical protein